MYDPMNIKTLTLDLGGRWMRSYGTAPCPVCQPERRKRQNALTIAEQGGRLLMHCKKSGCDFRDLLAASGIAPGRVEIDLAALERAKRARIEADVKAQRQAQSLWRQGRPITGTQGETYLRGRGITSDMPESLRWLPETYHRPSQQSCAAMLAQVRSVADEPMGLHRTFFTKQGERLSQSPKMMLGPCRGGAVRLFEAKGPLVRGRRHRNRPQPCLRPPQRSSIDLGGAQHVGACRFGTAALPRQIDHRSRWRRCGQVRGKPLGRTGHRTGMGSVFVARPQRHGLERRAAERACDMIVPEPIPFQAEGPQPLVRATTAGG